jgi:hypothetical protein
VSPQQALNSAVLYALREGCFFPVPQPRAGASVRDLIQWGALRHLHDAIREADRAGLFRPPSETKA